MRAQSGIHLRPQLAVKFVFCGAFDIDRRSEVGGLKRSGGYVPSPGQLRPVNRRDDCFCMTAHAPDGQYSVFADIQDHPAIYLAGAHLVEHRVDVFQLVPCEVCLDRAIGGKGQRLGQIKARADD